MTGHQKPPRALLRGLTGGHPAGWEDFVPLNPWGRPMPRSPRKRPQLYQLFVRDRLHGNRETPVGPKMQDRGAVEMACLALSQSIHAGAEKRWMDPVVVPVPSELDRTIDKPGIRISL